MLLVFINVILIFKFCELKNFSSENFCKILILRLNGYNKFEKSSFNYRPIPFFSREVFSNLFVKKFSWKKEIGVSSSDFTKVGSQMLRTDIFWIIFDEKSVRERTRNPIEIFLYNPIRCMLRKFSRVRNNVRIILKMFSSRFSVIQLGKPYNVIHKTSCASNLWKEFNISLILLCGIFSWI